MIFSYLHIREVKEAGIVCKKWKTIIDENNHYWSSKLSRVFKMQIENPKLARDMVVQTYANLQTVHQKKHKPGCSDIGKHFFYCVPSIGKIKKNLFKIQNDSIYYAIDGVLFSVNKFGTKKLETIIPHTVSITALEISERLVITGGVDVDTQHNQNSHQIKLWNADDLSLFKEVTSPMRVVSLHMIDQHHLLSGHDGQCILWDFTKEKPEQVCNLVHKKEETLINTPILFMYSLQSKEGLYIVTKDENSTFYFWKKNYKLEWEQIKTINKPQSKQSLFIGVADCLIEGKTNGEIWVHGIYKYGYMADLLPFQWILPDSNCIRWMQFDNGSLYIAGSDREIHRFDFTEKSKGINQLPKNKPHFLKQLSNDLKHVPAVI